MVTEGGQARFTLTPKSDYQSAVTGCNGTLTGLISADCEVTATFSTELYPLTVTTSTGGKVASDPAGIDCGTDCYENYVQGTNVTLTATPDPDTLFTVWSGACVGVNPICTVTMNAGKIAIATFELVHALLRLTVATIGSGSGCITSTPAGIDCGNDCSEDYASATEVTLTALAEEGSAFGGWLGACSG